MGSWTTGDSRPLLDKQLRGDLGVAKPGSGAHMTASMRELNVQSRPQTAMVT